MVLGVAKVFGCLLQLLADNVAVEEFLDLLEVVVEGGGGLIEGDGDSGAAGIERVADFLAEYERKQVHGEGEELAGEIKWTFLFGEIDHLRMQVTVDLFKLTHKDGLIFG